MFKLLIAVDGSEHASRAVTAVGRMATHGAALRVLLVNVRSPMVYYGELPPYDLDQVERSEVHHQQEILDAAEAQARAAGLQDVSIRSAVGEPASEIVRLAGEEGVDQIVMGTHGRGLLGSLFVGSVAQRVLHLGTLPVLLVK